MKCAVFGDVHGNSGALEAVLADAEKAGVDTLVCLGDVASLDSGPTPGGAYLCRYRNIDLNSGKAKPKPKGL